ncbi:hypothetical protein [Aureisphaera sp.]
MAQETLSVIHAGTNAASSSESIRNTNNSEERTQITDALRKRLAKRNDANTTNDELPKA